VSGFNQESIMKWLRPVLAFIVVALGQTTAIVGVEPDGLTSQQQERLKQLEAKLRAVPARPESPDEQMPVVQKNLREFLALGSRPLPGPTNNLARSLVGGINGATISVPQSVGLVKELAKVLSQPKITPEDTFKFTNAIDPFVQGTGLDNATKMRLYREALRVVETAPNYVYNQNQK
jgi:hypothetical protein